MSLCVPFGLFVALVAATSVAQAHPLSQGSIDVTVHPDRVTVRARVTDEEVSVTNMLVPAPATPATPASGPAADGPMAAAFRQHAPYFATHLRVSGDGRPMTGRVVRIVPPGETDPHPALAGIQRGHVGYEIEYRPVDGAAPAPPSHVELSQDVLVGVSFLPGTSWEATYVTRIRQENGPALEGMLLTSRAPVTFACEWKADGGTSAGQGARQAGVNGGRLVREYVVHGIHHILSGWDHLLFVSALVLATKRLWDLVKVVSAFTLAHTITLTLAALHWVHLPAQIVEPLIAASIVFVAVQNVFWPEQSRGWGRLAAAFFFGLFHGLGFAGGLLEAMQEMQTTTILLAIASFSLGVEIGHQLVVLPLFGALKLARHSRSDDTGQDRISLLAQRFGSAAISVAGMFYLVMALRASLTGA